MNTEYVEKIPNGVKGKLSFLEKIHLAVIGFVIGKRPVMANLNVDIIPEFPDVGLVLDSVQAGLFKNVSFPRKNGMILKLSTATKC